jgi:predicted transcriptional regulator
VELHRIVDALGLTVAVGGDGLKGEVEGGYVSDMLSDVIANTRKGDLWLTLQVHQNIVAVAVLKELAGIVLIGGKTPADETIRKAKDENVIIITTPLPAFEVCGRLYALGLRGRG